MADDVAELSDDRFSDVRADIMAARRADREGRSASLLSDSGLVARDDRRQNGSANGWRSSTSRMRDAEVS